jgi:hypothetical protein
MTALRDTIEDDRLRRLLDYWERKRAGRTMPGRPDIDPVEIAFVLGYILLIDVHDDPLRFRFRLVGMHTPRRQNIDLTGVWLDQLPLPEVRASMQASYAEVVAARAPSRAVRDEVRDGHRIRWEVLRLPLAADGEHVDMLMIGVIERPA